MSSSNETRQREELEVEIVGYCSLEQIGSVEIIHLIKPKPQEEPKCNECDETASKKYIGQNKSEYWGTIGQAGDDKHPYHWNLCDGCFRLENYDDDDSDDDEEEEEEEPKCDECDETASKKHIGWRPQTRIGECEGCPWICEECERLVIVEEESDDDEEEEEEEYEYNACSISKLYKVVIMVAGGGMMNGNAYANIEGEWKTEEDYENGEDGEIYYCEYGSNPSRQCVGTRIIWGEDDNFNIE